MSNWLSNQKYLTSLPFLKTKFVILSKEHKVTYMENPLVQKL
jgi:hypothetical protein